MNNLLKAVGIVAIGLTVLITDAGADWTIQGLSDKGVWLDLHTMPTADRCFKVIEMNFNFGNNEGVFQCLNKDIPIKLVNK